LFYQRKSLPALFIILITFTIISCKGDINGPFVSEDEIIGSWQLTKIIASYSSGTKELTPEEENIEFTITLDSSRTYQRYQNYNGDIINDNGTWNLENGRLTLISDSGSITFLIKLNGDKLQVAATLTDPDSGILVPVTLEFSKNI
jgi:hypothetical protein